MKPLHLLFILCGLAIVGGSLLLFLKPPTQVAGSFPVNSLPEAPVPFSSLNEEDLEWEIKSLLTKAPLLTEPLIPDPQLIAFVEKHLGQVFLSPPVFTPTSPEDLILTASEFIKKLLYDDLSTASLTLGFHSEYLSLDQALITILAGEVRGLILGSQNLIHHRFQSHSPPDQAALVNLLAQRLITQSLPTTPAPTSIDHGLARQALIRTLALATEKEFRKTLPAYPPSLHENIRESILLGLPAFLHEMASLPEFHLVPKISNPSTKSLSQVLTHFTQPKEQNHQPLSSRELLSYPSGESSPTESTSADWGAFPLYLMLLNTIEPTIANSLAIKLINDEMSVTDSLVTWSLTFTQPEITSQVAEHLNNIFVLQKNQQKMTVTTSGQNLTLQRQRL